MTWCGSFTAAFDCFGRTAIVVLLHYRTASPGTAGTSTARTRCCTLSRRTSSPATSSTQVRLGLGAGCLFGTYIQWVYWYHASHKCRQADNLLATLPAIWGWERVGQRVIGEGPVCVCMLSGQSWDRRPDCSCCCLSGTTLPPPGCRARSTPRLQRSARPSSEPCACGLQRAARRGGEAALRQAGLPAGLERAALTRSRL
jgi:hypothetical protein